jgi:hypothetical protein
MARTRVSLNGNWEFYPLESSDLPAALPSQADWQENCFKVPSSWRWSMDLTAEYQPYNLFEYPAIHF